MDSEVMAMIEARSIPEPNTGCWLWTAGMSSSGYGTVRHEGKDRRAHRVSFEATSGRPIPPGMFICHKCDIPSCVNPDHLFLGTHKDNMRDRDSKGRNRTSFGEANGRTKLTAKNAAAIRADIRTTHVVAGEYGVCGAQVRRIRAGTSWPIAPALAGPQS